MSRVEGEVKVEKLKNGRVANKAEVTGHVIKSEGQLVTDWIYKICKMGLLCLRGNRWSTESTSRRVVCSRNMGG